MNMNKKGFSLVELMIVIAVISILVTLMIPKFTRSKAKTQLTACKSKLRQVGAALEMHANDNKRLYPPAPSTPAAL